MKKLLLLAGLLAAGSTAAQAQITPEVVLPGTSNFPMIKLSTGDMKYLTQDYNTGQVTLCNLNHSLYKQFTIPVPSGYIYPNLAIVADALFDTNPSTLEYLVSYTNSTNNGLNRSIIYTETGSPIAVLDSVNGQNNIRYYNTPAGTKMVTRPYVSNSANPRVYTRVYGLPGTYTALKSADAASTMESGAFPNPTSERVQLPYSIEHGQQGTLVVLDMTGRVVRTFTIGSQFSDLILDVSDFAPGAYVYHTVVNGVSSTGKRFVVKR